MVEFFVISTLTERHDSLFVFTYISHEASTMAPTYILKLEILALF